MACPKVTVIIPVYNTGKYLRECLDSVVNQTLKDIEIICVDDGSTDASPAILREYEKKDPRVHILTRQHSNAGAARNQGLQHATGEYLSFLDADDFFELDMLETAYGQARKDAAEITVFRCDDFNMESGRHEARPSSILEENLPGSRPFAGAEVKMDLFGTFVGWTWDKLFLREYIAANQMCFQEQRTTNDLLFTYFALAKAERITIVEKVLAHHRTHVHMSLEATRSASWMCFYQALCALRDALKSAGLYTRFERDFVNYCVSFSLWNLDTMPWPIQEELYCRLRLLWFEDLGVPAHERDIFYDPSEFERMRRIIEQPYSVFLHEQIVEREQWLDDIRHSASFRIGRAVTWLPRKVRGGIRYCRDHGLACTLRDALYRMGLRKDEEPQYHRSSLQ